MNDRTFIMPDWSRIVVSYETGVAVLKSTYRAGEDHTPLSDPQWITPDSIARFSSELKAHAASKYVHVPPDIKAYRLSICGDCPFFLDSRCTKCSCFMDIKTGWASSQCPDEPPRWLAVIGESTLDGGGEDFVPQSFHQEDSDSKSQTP